MSKSQFYSSASTFNRWRFPPSFCCWFEGLNWRCALPFFPQDIADLDHSWFDCLMVAILTHGVSDKLYGTDGKLIPVEEVKKWVIVRSQSLLYASVHNTHFLSVQQLFQWLELSYSDRKTQNFHITGNVTITVNAVIYMHLQTRTATVQAPHPAFCWSLHKKAESTWVCSYE